MDYVKNQARTAKDDRHAWAEPGVEDLGGGLYRIPLPLPGDALTAVNVYAMAGDDGVDLIDAGMAITQARDRLTEGLGKLGFGLPDIRNFFITHVHQDHYTLAVELRTTLRGQIALGEAEQANLAAIQAVSDGREQVGFIAMLDRMGAAGLARQARAFLSAPGPSSPGPAGPQPQLQWSAPDRWLPDGALLDLPGRTLRAIHTPGHTSGHVVFHDESAGVLFAGDHVLPHITPSIGFQPVITRASLIQYLSSLRLMLTLPDTRLLPAHGPVKPSTHARVSELLDHHETRLAQILDAAAAGPVTAFSVAGAIPWTRRQRKLAELDPMNQLLAIGETAAHLEVLVARGQLAYAESPEGVDLYSLAAAPDPVSSDN